MSSFNEMISREDKEILRGAVDLHVHCGPEAVPAKGDSLDLAKQIIDFNMKAVVVKSHFTETSSWAALASKYIGPGIYGSVTLNWDVGGISPYPIRAALGPTYGEENLLKIVWMPTMHTADRLNRMKNDGKKEDIPKEWGGVSVKGIPIEIIKPIELKEYSKELEIILDMIAKNDLILATGHISSSESLALIDMAISHEIDKIILTHPSSIKTMKFSDNQIVECAKKGAYIEFCHSSTRSSLDIDRTIKLIQAVGPEKCILSSDFGRPQHPIPPIGLLKHAKELINAGVSESDVFKMLKDNPSYLLGID